MEADVSAIPLPDAIHGPILLPLRFESVEIQLKCGTSTSP